MARGTVSSLSARPPSPRFSVISSPCPSVITRSISESPSPSKQLTIISNSATDSLTSVSSLHQISSSSSSSSPNRFNNKRRSKNGKRLPQAPVFIGRPTATTKFPFPAISFLSSSDDESDNQTHSQDVDNLSIESINHSSSQTTSLSNTKQISKKQIKFSSSTSTSNTSTNPDRYCFLDDYDDYDNNHQIIANRRRFAIQDPIVQISSSSSTSTSTAPIPSPIIVTAELPSSKPRVWHFDDDFPSIAASESTACGVLDLNSPKGIRSRTKSFGNKNNIHRRSPSSHKFRGWHGSDDGHDDFLQNRAKRSSAADSRRAERLSFAESIRRSFGFSKTYRRDEKPTPLRESMGCTGLFASRSKRRETLNSLPKRNLRRFHPKNNDSDITESRVSIRADEKSAWDSKTAEDLLINSMLAYDDFMHSPSKPSTAAKVLARFRRT